MLTLCFLGSFVAGTAVGQTLWEENGHYYLIVEQETTWQQARLLAESMVFMGVQGHLATITSEAENTFVTTQLGDTAGAWLGGAQPLGSEEPAGGWRWITGEPWVYTNWDEGEPNNTYLGGWGKDATGQSEERLQYHRNGTHWNDLPDDPEVVTPRFIVEWDVAADVEEVAIDIKPGSFPNSINPKSHGVIPVAILTTDTFDATTIDPLSIQFGPSGATEAYHKGHIEDVNHDGEPDLVLHFKTQATGIQCGDTSASLTGETFDGDPIQGSDAIKTVGCKK
jgi:Lectin C-type domain